MADSSSRTKERTGEREISLEEVLRQSCRIIDTDNELGTGIRNTTVGMSPVLPIMPIIPLAPSRMDQSPDIKFSKELNRTLMVGKDLLDETDICRGAENFKSIAKILVDNSIERLNGLQRCAWPHIVRGRDCTILGGTHHKKGKSISYLAPLGYLCKLNAESFQLKQKGDMELIGPVGLILCGTSKSCHKVSEMLHKFLYGTPLVTLTIGDSNDKDAKRSLKKTTDFVVTTAKGAVDLFNEHFDNFRFERLRFLVVDDTQHVFRHHVEDFIFMIEKIHNFRSKLKDVQPLQTIFCGTEWNDVVRDATLNICNDAVILIESSMASIQYGNIDAQVHYFANKDEKMDTVQRLCQGFPVARILIICAIPITVEDIRVKLVRLCNITTYTLADKSNVEKTRQFKRLWENSAQQKIVFIITDPVMKELEIYNAQYIIHYELPLGRKEAFADRHMSMWSNFPAVTDYGTRGDDALRSLIPLESHVFITSEDSDFHKIVYKLHEIGVSIPEDLLNYAKLEMARRSLRQRLCDDFLAFGQCINTNPCVLRHQFTNEDFSPEATLPSVGRIKVRLVGMVDVNVFRAQLLKYYDVDVNKSKSVGLVRYENRQLELQRSLDIHFSNNRNPINLDHLRVGSYCVVQDNEKVVLRRARITEIIGINTDEPNYRVFCIDVGGNFVRKQNEIFELPDSLGVKSVKQMIVRLFLAGMKPFAKEPFFSSKAKYTVARSYNRILNGEFTGNIVLSVGNDVWVNPLVEHKKVEVPDSEVRADIKPRCEWVVVRNLLVEFTRTLNCGERNPEHMELLYQSCENDCGINCDRYRAVHIIGNDLAHVFFRGGESFQWAFLPTFGKNSSDNPYTSVWCLMYFSIHEAYVTRDKNVNQLEKLLKEIDNSVVAMISGKYAKYATVFQEYYEVGLPVAIYDDLEKKWVRGLIIKKEVIDNEPTYDIFLVDCGDLEVGVQMQNMFPLKSNFATDLPFQAIRIGCKHILPAIDGSTEQLNEVVKPHFIKDETSQMLEVNVKSKEAPYTLNGIPLCMSYDCLVLVMESESTTSMEIGELVSSKGVADVSPEGLAAGSAWRHAMLSYWNKVVDEATVGDQEDDDSDEEQNFDLFGDEDDDDAFAVHLGFNDESTNDAKVRLATQMLRELGVVQSEDSDNVSKRIALPAITSTSTSKSTNATGPGEVIETASIAPTSVTVVVPPSSGRQLNIPRVEWKQTPELIIIWIHIPDLTDHSLKIIEESQGQRVVFVSHQPDGYGFELALVGRVCSNFTENLTGQDLTVKFQKLSRNMRWPCLLAGNPKYRWLKRRIDEKTLEGNEEDGYDKSDDDDSSVDADGDGREDYLPAGIGSDTDDEEVENSDDLLSDDDDEGGGVHPDDIASL